MSISDRIVVMRDGVIQQIGRPQEVYDSPANLFVAQFLGTPPINVFQGEIRCGALTIGGEEVLRVRGAADQPVWAAVRPEGFVLDENGPFTCGLTEVEVMGRDITVVFRHPAAEKPALRAIISAENRRQVSGGTVRFRLKPQKVFLFHRETGERLPAALD